jgi:polyisoprenyl-teichoic acid--peptidoglycan teichoic acid transferase
VLLLAILLVCAGGIYGYVRYQWSRVKTIACSACAAVDDSQPFNVLIVGSDSRAGNTGSASSQFGSSSQVAGQRSDTIKILHVDPANSTAQLLSIPRDTYVQMSDIPASTGLTTDNKINTAFNNGPNPLVQTIENTFGIPIQHFVILDFSDEVNLVNAVGGISLDFPFPVRDDDNGNNNSGLNIPNAGCQTLNGTQALALSRSRYYEYYQNGVWQQDQSSDIGRIERQNIIIQAVIDKAKSLYNPIGLNSFISSLANDMTVDKNMSIGTMFALAERYHAFSGSSLNSYTIPTTPASNNAGDVEIVQQPQAQQMITQFLGTQPQQVTTPPLDQYGNPISTAASAPNSTAGSGSSSPSSPASTPGGSSDTNSGVTPSSIPFYDPKPC